MRFISLFIATPLLLSTVVCTHSEHHARKLTHPPKLFGEYVTRTAATPGFPGQQIQLDIPGRRNEFSSYTLKNNISLNNRRNVVEVAIHNPTSDTPLPPHVVTVIFFDGPEGAPLDTLSHQTEVIPPGDVARATLRTMATPDRGTYYWAFQIARPADWEAQLQAYSEAAEADEDSDEWDADDWQ